MNFLEQIASPKTRIPFFFGESMRSWYRWPTRLALDAPLVGVVWQQFLASVYQRSVPMTTSLVLALSIWGIYLLDRWNDARSVRTDTNTDRHAFARDHRSLFASLGIGSLIVALGLAIWTLPSWLIVNGLTLLLGVMVYGGLVHYWKPRWFSEQGGKEISVGVLFTLGLALPLLPPEMNDFWRILPALGGFAAVASVNCLLISDWETGSTSLRRREMIVAGVVAGLMMILAPQPMITAIGLSLIALIQLDRWKTKLDLETRRTLVDVALLTPLLVIGFNSI